MRQLWPLGSIFSSRQPTMPDDAHLVELSGGHRGEQKELRQYGVVNAVLELFNWPSL
jgi:hypothetical protein